MGLGDILRLTDDKPTRKEDKKLRRRYEVRERDGIHYLVDVFADGRKERKPLNEIPKDERPEKQKIKLRDHRGKERARDETVANGQSVTVILFLFRTVREMMKFHTRTILVTLVSTAMRTTRTMRLLRAFAGYHLDTSLAVRHGRSVQATMVN